MAEPTLRSAAVRPARYTATAKWLHWIVALFIIAAWLMGTVMTDIPGITPTKLRYFNWHKWMGVTIFGLVCLRLLWRLSHPAPQMPPQMPGWQQQAAHWAHVLLYALIFALPISGYFYSLAAGYPIVYLGLLPLPVLMGPNPELKPVLHEVHEILGNVLLAVFIVHVAAALKHHFINRDDVLTRMLPGRR